MPRSEEQTTSDAILALGRGLGRAWTRAVYFAVGLVCLAVGTAGLFLPVLPGVVFLILAAAAFARSSPRLEAWILDHPRLGPPVRRWRETGAIPRRIKLVACACMGASWVLVLASSAPLLVKIGIVPLVLAASALYVLTRPDETGA